MRRAGADVRAAGTPALAPLTQPTMPAQTQLCAPLPPAHSAPATRSCSDLEAFQAAGPLPPLPFQVEGRVWAEPDAPAPWGGRFWPLDSHMTMGAGIAHPPLGAAVEGACAAWAARSRSTEARRDSTRWRFARVTFNAAARVA